MHIPVLMYHALSRSPDKSAYTLREKKFAEQLAFLHANHFSCPGFEDYMETVRTGKSNLHKKCVLLTFDDGHESDYTMVLPLLQQYAFRATFFITTGWIGTNGYMNKEQLLSLKKSGMSIQSHAQTHRFLDGLPPDALAQELSESRDAIEQIVHSRVEAISFPGGRYSRQVIESARAQGYQACFCSAPRGVRTSLNMFLIGRHAMKQSLGMDHFKRILTHDPFFAFSSRAQYGAAYLIKRALGNQRYHDFWKRYLKSSSQKKS
ncbi:MAG: polysaccharide deacetylase family protein [Nitrospirota bacterium]